jgi:hypothetical protein
MFLGIITLITALAMAGIAAWFAIAGIMAIFAGAPMAALAMGVVIELGKVVGVSWLYRNWKEKTALKGGIILVSIAMLLTSMGIFGFLSKAHMEQTAPAEVNVAQTDRIDLRVEREKKRIEDATKVKKQLDDTVQALIDTKRIRGASGAKAVRESQQAQRDELDRVINDAEDQIATMEDQKMVLTSEKQKLALEVGPVKYIAGFFYEDVESNMEKVVRWVIVAFIFVFDPMAIWLLMAANYTFMNRKKVVAEPETKSKTIVPNATASFVPAEPVTETPVAAPAEPPVSYVFNGPGQYAKVPKHSDENP